MISGRSVGWKSYFGLAAMIRQRLIAGVVLSLAIGGLAILAILLMQYEGNYWHPRTYTVVSVAALIGALAGSLLALRLSSRLLRSLETVERELAEGAESSDQVAGADLDPQEPPETTLDHAYYSFLQRLEDREALQLEFLAMICHEIRSPLATILGYSELLGDPSYQADPNFLGKCSQVIINQGNRLDQFIETVLTAALAERGRIKLHLEPFDLGLLMERVTGEASRHSGRSIRFDNEGMGAVVTGDVLRLREALLRLIDYALQLGGTDDPLNVVLRPSSNAGQIEIPVTGSEKSFIHGQPQPLLKIFERIRNPEAGAIPGPDLALYTVNEIVERHGGTFGLNSDPAGGMTFTIHLPLNLHLDRQEQF